METHTDPWLAAQARDARLLRRTADQADGRRSPLVLTATGRRALDQVHGFRRRVVAEAITGWSAEDRAALARLLTRFVDDIARHRGARLTLSRLSLGPAGGRTPCAVGQLQHAARRFGERRVRRLNN